MSRRIFLALSAALAALASPAAAQTGIRAGATVTDAQGGTVGTIASVDGESVTLRTDRHEVRLGVSSFTVTDDAILFGATREQLNADLDRLAAQTQQAIAVGAAVHDRNGALVGPIEATDERTLIVKFGEQLIRLPRDRVAAGPDGLMIGATVAELRAETAAGASATQ